jgi:hypothetical protein
MPDKHPSHQGLADHVEHLLEYYSDFELGGRKTLK